MIQSSPCNDLSYFSPHPWIRSLLSHGLVWVQFAYLVTNGVFPNSAWKIRGQNWPRKTEEKMLSCSALSVCFKSAAFLHSPSSSLNLLLILLLEILLVAVPIPDQFQIQLSSNFPNPLPTWLTALLLSPLWPLLPFFLERSWSSLPVWWLWTGLDPALERLSSESSILSGFLFPSLFLLPFSSPFPFPFPFQTVSHGNLLNSSQNELLNPLFSDATELLRRRHSHLIVFIH